MTESVDDDQTPWLTRRERQAWLATASIMFSLPAALDARLQRESNLTFVQYMVLAVLSERPDHTLQLSDLAAGVSASLSRLSHVLNRLEERGLVRRCRVAGPGRRSTATLSERGLQTVRAAAPDHVRAVRGYLIDALDDADLAVMNRVGEAVAARLNPDRPFRHGAAGDRDRQEPTA